MISIPLSSTGKSDETTAAEKEAELRRLMRELRSVLVAYSGGVDSTYLAYIASQELADDAVCVLGLSPSVSEHQRREAEAAARSGGFEYLTCETFEVDDERYAANPVNRCYFCKSELYARLGEMARDRGIRAVVDGTNADDLADHRPGRKAADESGVASPLATVGFTKAEIRIRSRAHNLNTWDSPASPCLSSRIAHGVPVTIERLGRVERGEAVLRGLGFREFRVRVHDDLARIEVARSEFGKALDPQVLELMQVRFKEIGFRYVTLDLKGFRSGSTNGNVPSRTIPAEKQTVELENV